MLVIADNVSSEGQARPLLPGSGPHRVVVTSRHTLGGLDARLLDVKVLDDAASVALLDTVLRAARPDDERISGDRDAAERLAEICGGLPLALRIVAALLKADLANAASELADELAVERVRLEGLRYDDGTGTSAPSVGAAFELSYRRLDETSARVFRALSLNPGPDLSPAAVAVLADLPATQILAVLGGLAKAHLIETAPGMVGRWRMHELLRLHAERLSDTYADADADADGREHTRDRLLSYYLRVADAANGHLQMPSARPVPEDFIGRTDALAWLDAERPNLVAGVRMAADTGRDQAALDLAFVMFDYFLWRRRFDDLLVTATISLNTARHLSGQGYEGKALNSLGIALQGMRRFEEAITAHRDAAAIFREISDQRGEAMALGNLGPLLLEVGRFEEAITADQDAAAIFREIGDRHNEGQAVSNLGGALGAAGQLDKAITVLGDAAAISRETGDRHGEGQALVNLGIALEGVRRFEEAITALRDAAAIFRETGDRHGEGQALYNLGLALWRMRRSEEAITAFRDAAAIFRETGDRRSESTALNNLRVARAGGGGRWWPRRR